jgi:hypothetical protein
VLRWQEEKPVVAVRTFSDVVSNSFAFFISHTYTH